MSELGALFNSVTGQRRSTKMLVVCIKEGMQESLLWREFPTSISLNNQYPPRKRMLKSFYGISIFSYYLFHYLLWSDFPACNALSECGSCLELPEGESGCELPPHLSWSERERSELAGMFFPFSFVSAARGGNRNWPMSYWVNTGPQSQRPPDHRAWRLNTPWVPAGCVVVGISFPWCRTLHKLRVVWGHSCKDPPSVQQGSTEEPGELSAS